MTASCLGHIAVVHRLLQCREIDANVQACVKKAKKKKNKCCFKYDATCFFFFESLLF